MGTDPLWPAYNRLLTDEELVEMGRSLSRDSGIVSPYARRATALLTAPREPLRRVAGAWSTGCDSRVITALSNALTQLPRQLAPPLVVDLFRGPGTLGFELARRLGGTVFAAEPDAFTQEVSNAYLARAGAGVRLHNVHCRDLPQAVAPRGPRDIYLVEPPWQAAAPGQELDLDTAYPPIRLILQDISRARGGRPYAVVLKTGERINRDSLERAFAAARHLRYFTSAPPLAPNLPGGPPPAHYHLYAVPGWR
ncbi:hypothetical protein [Streptantibioticus ferralitis]|uniref:Methyltransferase n=1 Tax=Streptantibioticus ferralitis TaxID=236510 RepID=A0ABT5YX11_9ACTN|nr:hypothetical protein [Streptantibioticus ferralitis]MDF2256131.1 hypothetical protein [Streptantibioticus ferralitis]